MTPRTVTAVGRAPTDTTRVAVLLSGRGSNFVALADSMARGDVPAEIVLVVSNRPDAAGLEKASDLGLDAACIAHRGEASRAAHEARILVSLRAVEAEWICLAGYMRLLGPTLVEAYPRRILNIHPSLLPAFPGLDVQQAALDHGVRVSGCTVHFVDAGLDSGPIVAQRPVEVVDGDTAESLAARILVQEHQAYPEALRRLLTEEWRIEGRRVVFGSP